jgi:hypothetical protein
MESNFFLQGNRTYKSQVIKKNRIQILTDARGGGSNTLSLLSDFDAEHNPDPCTRERKWVRSGNSMPFENMQRNTFRERLCTTN